MNVPEFTVSLKGELKANMWRVLAIAVVSAFATWLVSQPWMYKSTNSHGVKTLEGDKPSPQGIVLHSLVAGAVVAAVILVSRMKSSPLHL